MTASGSAADGLRGSFQGIVDACARDLQGRNEAEEDGGEEAEEESEQEHVRIDADGIHARHKGRCCVIEKAEKPPGSDYTEKGSGQREQAAFGNQLPH